MFLKIRNMIDRYSWFFFGMMLLILFLSYLWPLHYYWEGVCVEYLIMTRVFPLIGILLVLISILFRKLNLLMLGLLFYFALWIKILLAFSVLPNMLGF